MFGKGIKLFTLLGFEVRMDWSWLIIAALLTWNLALGIFPRYVPGLPPGTYWFMAVLGTLGLFLSIVLHELGHSIVARSFGIPMNRITLFIFGGVAEMGGPPPTAKSEFWMAIAGPIASILLAMAAYGAQLFGGAFWPRALSGVLGYLAWINLIVAIFNLVPAFPLDGGRVLRSALWAWKRNLRWATRVASLVGSGFAFFLIGFGIFNFLAGSFVAGLWYVLLGMFLRGAAQMSYQQVVLRQTLAGEPVKRFMNSVPVAVAPSTSLQDLVDDYFYKFPYKFFPVVAGEQLVGCVAVDQVKLIPKERWPQQTVQDVMVPCSDKNTIDPDADAVQALTTMNQAHLSRLMVVDHGRLLGIVALKDLMNFLSRKMELEPA